MADDAAHVNLLRVFEQGTHGLSVLCTPITDGAENGYAPPSVLGTIMRDATNDQPLVLRSAEAN